MESSSGRNQGPIRFPQPAKINFYLSGQDNKWIKYMFNICVWFVFGTDKHQHLVQDWNKTYAWNVSNLKLFKKMLLQALNMHFKQFNTFSTITNHTFLFTFLKDPIYVHKMNILIVGLRLVLGVCVPSREMSRCFLASWLVSSCILNSLLSVNLSLQEAHKTQKCWWRWHHWRFSTLCISWVSPLLWTSFRPKLALYCHMISK